ncbi:purine-binding chemotaxis protein CheW [Phormidium sp. LEGE 05292]|uniref:chemotaxis protein CheW n=1 Tax=[Phormidium] sp. LEGE 05292 TaxID=767427 RepID=UPI001882B87F|nr:chemotaxis protein CheW [Phormidium sp. LEGE 05292]MBE9226249.1 purine-binding chemotaxis protein CheW [Phormidium sp. LEGE 05292]
MTNKPYLIFRINSSLYGVEAFCVQEIFSLPNLTPIAESSADLVGVVNLRGDILPVIDLNIRFGYEQLDYSLTDTIIVLEWQEFRLGIIVNQVLEVHNISLQEVTTELFYKQELNGRATHFLAGIGKVEADIIMLLNHESLLCYSQSLAPLGAIKTIENGEYSDKLLKKQLEFCPQATLEEKAILRERAENLRQATQKEDFAGLIPLAVVGLNGEYFGLDLAIVREFTDIRQVTPVPCCPPHIVGNMNLRGEILTLVDIRTVLNMPILEIENITNIKVMIIKIDDLIAGVTVDEVFDVMYLQPSQILPVPTAVHSANSEYLRGTANYREKMMSILDLAKVFQQGDLIVNEEV